MWCRKDLKGIEESGFSWHVYFVRMLQADEEIMAEE